MFVYGKPRGHLYVRTFEFGGKYNEGKIQRLFKPVKKSMLVALPA